MFLSYFPPVILGIVSELLTDFVNISLFLSTPLPSLFLRIYPDWGKFFLLKLDHASFSHNCNSLSFFVASLFLGIRGVSEDISDYSLSEEILVNLRPELFSFDYPVVNIVPDISGSKDTSNFPCSKAFIHKHSKYFLYNLCFF